MAGKLEAASYIAELATELSQMARANGFDSVAFCLEMVVADANTQKAYMLDSRVYDVRDVSKKLRDFRYSF